MSVVLAVHGVWNHRRRETPEQAAASLARSWQASLATGMRRANRTEPVPPVAVAYYADLLRRPGRQGTDDDLDDLTPDEAQFARDWLRHVGLPDGVAAGWSTIEVRQAVETLARARGLGAPATRWFVAGLFREVHAYLRTPENPARAAVRERVASAIAATDARIIVAHSLGSVVAYETLWAQPHFHIDMLVTLGSPLALPHAVFPKLDPAPRAGRGARPPGVRRWVNLADPGDIVAVPKGGISAAFDGVDIDEHTLISAFDFHKAANYLSHKRLAEILADRIESTGRSAT